MEKEQITNVNLELAKKYLSEMEFLLNNGSFFQFGNVRREFKGLLKSMERRGYFSREQVSDLREEYNSIADSRIIAHLDENF
ncbi:hypothetical protein K9L16_00580 [Candidatus Pacearchaeota archaeon]|nr:hypothetical protein [Candidatus Pacearchaeota archaeon]